MKSLIIVLSLIIFFTTNAYSATDCKNVKKTSPKYLLCKTKAAGNILKDKLNKNGKSNKNKSFLKKFGEAKSLSDLK